jgi:hypothetical protein
LRGGAEVGLGTDLFPDEVYGPVISAAYELEANVAEYPRTAVGPKLVQTLSYLEQYPQTTPAGRAVTNVAHGCKRFLCEAPDDQRQMIHFLSDETCGSSTRDRREFARRCTIAHDVVRAEIERFNDEKNIKLLDRYLRLNRYFEAYKTA